MTEWDKLQEEVIRASFEFSYVRANTPDYWEAKRKFEFAVCALADLIRDTRDP
jgi:hypothetical protein